MVHGLLGQAKFPGSAKADLDDHEIARRSRIDRDDVQLGTPDPDLATEDRPAGSGEVGSDEYLGGVAAALLGGPHESMVGRAAARRLTWSQAGASASSPSSESSSARSADSARIAAPSSNRSSGSWSPASVR